MRTRAQPWNSIERPAELPLLAVFSATALEARASVPRTGRRVQANSTILACAVEIGQCAIPCGNAITGCDDARVERNIHGPWRFLSTLWKVRVSFDLANLLNMTLGMSGDFEHPLPTIDRLSRSEAMSAQIVVGRLDVFDHDRSQRLELCQGFSEVLISIDLLVPAAQFLYAQRDQCRTT